LYLLFDKVLIFNYLKFQNSCQKKESFYVIEKTSFLYIMEIIIEIIKLKIWFFSPEKGEKNQLLLRKVI